MQCEVIKVDVTDKIVGVYYSKNGINNSLFLPHHILIEKCEELINQAASQTHLESQLDFHKSDKISL